MPEQLHPDFDLHSYAFELPEELIAQFPAPERAASRLMILDRRASGTKTDRFGNLLAHLPENCLLVANNSRVVPARVFGSRPGGGKVEMLLLTPPPLLKENYHASEDLFPGWQSADAEVLLRPAKKIQENELVSLSDDLVFSLLERKDFGRCLVRLTWQGDLVSVLERCGATPLPPYIRRPGPDRAAGSAMPDLALETDKERYQTVYADKSKAGSVAAPTAGLHFTPELRDRLLASGREWAEVTLYVGYGTFSPVRSRDIREHEMHTEYVELPESAAAAVVRAKQEGRPVIAVGTTSARTLEGVFAAQHSGLRRNSGGAFAGLTPHSGWINAFLYPGRPFSVIDGLLTNFHLPESSLLMLISALAGRERILAAYKEAIARNFRFFSYGDAMLIL